MLGLNDYIIVIVVNAIGPNKKPTNYFDTTSNIMTAALNSIQDSMGNQHARTNIQKQAFPSDLVTSIRGAFGITGTNFNTHSPYVNGQRMSLDANLINKTEVVLIKNDLNVREALLAASRHQILPSRKNPNIPSKLGEVLPPLEQSSQINIESTDKDPGPDGAFGAGNAGNPGGYADFGE